MRILALDAALGACSVAVVLDGVLLSQRSSVDARGASTALPRLVEEVLAESGRSLDLVAVTVGPGSFTGIRAALALAHGLSIGVGVPVVGVTSVAALTTAWTPVVATKLWVAIDTHRGGLFLARDGMIEVVTLEMLIAPPGIVELAGDAAASVSERIGGMVTGIDSIDAFSVAQAAAVPANRVEPQPLYIEPPDARPTAPLRPAPL